MRGESVVKDVIINPALILQVYKFIPVYALIFHMTNAIILCYKFIPINYQSVQLISVNILRTVTWIEGFGRKMTENNF